MMQTITARNSSEGIRIVTKRIQEKGRLIDTKNGRTFVFDEPLMVNYTHPKECFVSDPGVDADPFKALLDAFWQLAGVGEVGERWRTHYGVDQVNAVVDLLRSNPETSRAVIQTYDARGGNENIKNTSVTFSVRRDCLDMLVTNHDSNVVDNLCGSEPVQYGMLQRVVADRLGVLIGQYWSCSSYVYLYKDQVERIEKNGGLTKNFYPDQTFRKIVSNSLTWDSDLRALVEKIFRMHETGDTEIPSYRNGFLGEVVFKACAAYYYYRKNEPSQAWLVADLIGDTAWREFCTQWLIRRTTRD